MSMKLTLRNSTRNLFLMGLIASSSFALAGDASAQLDGNIPIGGNDGFGYPSPVENYPFYQGGFVEQGGFIDQSGFIDQGGFIDQSGLS